MSAPRETCWMIEGTSVPSVRRETSTRARILLSSSIRSRASRVSFRIVSSSAML